MKHTSSILKVVTTVKIHESTKHELDSVRSGKETYDQVISKLISAHKEKNLRKELINSYKENNDFDLELVNEWESISEGW